MRVSRTQAAIVVRVLKRKFPWLGTNQEVSGADVVDGLNELMEVLNHILSTRTKRSGRGGRRPGSGRPGIAPDAGSDIRRLRREGKTWPQIADNLGISVRTAQRAVKR